MIMIEGIDLSSDMQSFIIFMIVLVLATSFCKLFLNRFDFDFIALNTSIFLIFLVFSDVIESYFIAVALLIFAAYIFFLRNRRKSD